MSDVNLYARSFGQFVQLGDEKDLLLKKILAHVGSLSGKCLLDIGGGFGHLSVPLSKLAEKTVVIEPNAFFAKQFRKIGISCIQNKWEEIDILSSSFDVVIAIFVVAHFPKSQMMRLIRKMMRVLRPGGRLIIVVVDGAEGSWREMHTIFYHAIGLKKRISSAFLLRRFMRSLNVREEKIKIFIRAKSKEKIINALKFDFLHHKIAFKKMRPLFSEYLEKKQKGKFFVLSNVLNFYCYKKPR